MSWRTTIVVRPVMPIAMRPSAAFVTRPGGCRLSVTEQPVYPTSDRGERLRKLRVDAGLTLGEASRRLGLRIVELSDLEHGRGQTDDDGWSLCFYLIEGAR